MRSGASLWLLLTAALAAPAARAETVYVIEQLVVTLASSQEADAEHIGQVKSGDRMELLEREGEEAHVRLPNGKEGWIKASYLTTEEPLAPRLAARTAEVETLKQEGEKLRQEGEKLRQDVTRLQSQLASSRSEAASAAAAATTPAGSHTGGSNGTAATTPTGSHTGGGNSTAAPAAGNTSGAGVSTTGSASTVAGPSTEAATSSPPEQARETVFLREPDRHGQTSWALVSGVAAAMLLVGFVLGWTTLDRRIRQKYGGLRIY